MRTPEGSVVTTYRGCRVVVDANDIMVVSPDGDLAFFGTMRGVRNWVRRKLRALREGE